MIGRSLPAVTAAARDVGGSARGHCRGPGRVHVQVRGLDGDQAPRIRAALRRALTALEAVDWAEVNEALGRVVVAFDEDRLDVADIIEVVAAVEAAHDVAGTPLPRHHVDHPGDDAPVRRAGVALVGGVAGLGLSVVGRVVRAAPVPAEVAALVSLVDATPRLRQGLEARLGAAPADLTLAVASATAQGLAHGSFGLAVDVLHHLGQLREARARRDAWRRREPELAGRPELAASTSPAASDPQERSVRGLGTR